MIASSRIQQQWIQEGEKTFSDIQSLFCNSGSQVKTEMPWILKNSGTMPVQFVGILLQGKKLLKFYPKYWRSRKPERHDAEALETLGFQQVIRVMERYRARQKISKAFMDDDVQIFTSTEEGASNRLAVLLGLLQDYHENGLYTRRTDIIESNGAGEIHWDQTVNNTMAILQDDCPYYVDLRTRRHIDDEYDFFRRLHGAVLTAASKELQNVGLLELFGITGTEISEEALDDFGETEYILYRLEQEENWQFNTRKQQVLRMMYAFLREEKTLQDADCLTVFGTMKYHVVWEAVCAEVLGNQLEVPLKSLPLDCRLSQSFANRKTDKLLKLIEKPEWRIRGQKGVLPSDSDEDETLIANGTLRPDVVSIEKDKQGNRWFMIFDAKYYKPNLDTGEGLPGIGDVTKQYLYQLVYNDFIWDHQMKPMNCLLFPSDTNDAWCESEKNGSVSFQILETVPVFPFLASVQVRFISAEKFYEFYIRGSKLEKIIDKLDLNEPAV